MNQFFRNLTPWLVIGFVLLVIFNMFDENANRGKVEEIPYSAFLQEVEGKRVKNVVITGSTLTGELSDDARFKTIAPNDPNLVNVLRENGIRFEVKDQSRSMHPLLSILISWFPMLLLIGVWIFFMRQMNSGGGKAMGFGKSRARLIGDDGNPITFKDVAGIDECKQEVQEIIDYLMDPRKFQKLGGKIPKGVLLVGPPGTGKTLLAKAIAGEAGVPFFTISGSDFVEMFVGVGASRVRDMFEQGRKYAPCLVFIDEIDAVGRHRGAGLGGGNDEREQTLNQLLVEMDGFDGHEGVIIIAATNRPDVLDPALLRPGRFDRQVTVPNPDIKGREEILNVHSKKVPLAGNVNLKTIARGTPGFSGADLANLVNEAALLAARHNRNKVTMHDFEMAKDKILMGPEKKSMVLSDRDKEITAYHEAGHALLALFMPEHDPLHKVTIIPRGRALGVTVSLPKEDKFNYTKIELESRLAMAFGGRIAEQLIYGEDYITTGASNDIQQATDMARRMVTEWGMSDLAPIRYNGDQEEVFLGHSVAQQKNLSDDMAKKIDAEIARIINESYDIAKKKLTERLDDLHKLAKALLEYETLSKEEVDVLLEGGSISDFRANQSDDHPTPPSKSQKDADVESIIPKYKKGNGKDKPSPQET